MKYIGLQSVVSGKLVCSSRSTVFYGVLDVPLDLHQGLFAAFNDVDGVLLHLRPRIFCDVSTRSTLRIVAVFSSIDSVLLHLRQRIYVSTVSIVSYICILWHK